MRTLLPLKHILLSFFLTLTALNQAFASETDGPGGTGGGNMVAAEIQRATDEFIAIVRANEQLFGIRASQLEIPGVQIRVTSKPILSCDGRSEFDAGSTRNQSVFNRFNWLNQDSWLAKVHLAGHERLILLGLEKSNQYPISNRLFQLNRSKNRLDTLSSPQEICASFETQWCLNSLRQLRESIASISHQVELGQNIGELSAIVEMQSNSAESNALLFEGILLAGGKTSQKARQAAASYKAYSLLLVEQLKEQIENGAQVVDVGCVTFN